MDKLKQVNLARIALGLPLFPPQPVVASVPGVDDPGDHYREWEHPRDGEGQWIEKGGTVKIGDSIAGVVESMNPDSTVNVRVTDNRDDESTVGQIVKASNSDITVVESKATLEAAQKMDMADVSKKHVSHAESVLASTTRMTVRAREKFSEVAWPYKPKPGGPEATWLTALVKNRFITNNRKSGQGWNLPDADTGLWYLTPEGKAAYALLNGWVQSSKPITGARPYDGRENPFIFD